jgi:hypothetical protein
MGQERDMTESRGVTHTGRLLAVAMVTLVIVAALVSAYLRKGVNGDELLFVLGGLSLLTTSSLLVLRVPENRLSWVGVVSATMQPASAGVWVRER